MKKIIVFGSTGGLGTQLIPFLETEYEVTALGSKDLDITSFQKTKEFFDNTDYDIILNMSGIKYDQFLSKITEEDIIEIDNMINEKKIINVSQFIINMKRLGYDMWFVIPLVFNSIYGKYKISGLCKPLIWGTDRIYLQDMNNMILCV